MEHGGDTIHCDELPWLPLAPKISVKVIKLVPETGGYSVMIRAEAGGVLPRHQHLASSEIYVIRGSGVHPQTGAYRPGDYVSERERAVHDLLAFPEDTELLMISSGPSAFLNEDDSVAFHMDVPMLERLRAAA